MFAFSSPADAFDAAMAQQAARNFSDAANLWRRALAEYGENPLALHHLGECDLQQKQFAAAEKAFRHALRLSPQAETLSALGYTLSAMGRHSEALSVLSKAQRMAPQDARIPLYAGNALSALPGREEDALQAFRQAIRLKPDFTMAHFHCGNMLARLGRPAEAESCYRTVLAESPRHLGAHNNLGNVLMTLDRPAEAIPLFQAAMRLAPAYPKSYFNLGCALAKADHHDDAIGLFEKALSLDPDYVRAWQKMGTSLHATGRITEAASAFREALKRKPDLAAAHFGLATCHQLEGDFTASHREIRKALTLTPKRPFYWNALVMTKHFTDPADPDITAVEALKTAKNLPESEQIRISFMLGKIYSDLGRYPDAFDAWQQGNRRMRATLHYDPARDTAMMAKIAETFSAAMLAEKQGAGVASDLPVFIVGMPRSGSSLVEQILASHSDVFGAGELNDFSLLFAEQICGGTPVLAPENLSPEAISRLAQAYLNALKSHAPKAKHIIDKMPGNFAYAGLIHLALPGAKIIHVHRDARDCCLSCYSKQFLNPQPFSYDLTELGRYYQAYEQLMAHWRKVLPPSHFIDVSYEDLVEDFEAQVKRLLAFCDLEWQESCRDFYHTKRVVRTASQAQVRQPLFTRSIGRWRHYEAQLAPLFRALNVSTPEKS